MTEIDVRRILDEGRDQHRAGRLDRAEAAYRRVLEADSGCAEAWHLLAAIAFHRGHAAASESHARSALAIDASQAKYHNTLASALVLGGRLADAEAELRRALELDPAAANAQFNLGNVLNDLGRGDEAEAAWRRAAEIDPGHVDALNNLGLTLMRRRRMDEAESWLRRAETAAPGNAAVLWNLASCLEQRNRLDEAAERVGRLLEVTPGDGRAELIAGRIARRQGRLAEAVGRLRPLVASADDDGVRLNACFELGLALDRLDQTAEAFAAFARGNELERQAAAAHGIDGEAYLANVARLQHWFTPERLAAWGAERFDDGTRAPVFFVGFPRSGTTLMEQVLAAHPGLVTTGERSPLERLREAWRRESAPTPYPERLQALTRDDVMQARAAFWRWAAEAAGGELGGRRLVDKLPLNVIHLGMVQRLFPEARVVVALRDPRDVCLSCFMQQFRPTASMVNFQCLETTVRLYAAVMDLWLAYRASIGLAWIEYRYEDLVTDLPGTARRVLDFIGEAWSDRVLDYRDEARARDILTPSYRDVGEAVFERAVGRWRRYADQLAPVLPALAPYVATFGYADPPAGGGT